MNKRTRNLVVLVICLGLVAAAGFIAIKLSKDKEATTSLEPTLESFVIFETDTSKIVHVDWVYAGLIEGSFTKTDGKWVWDDDPDAFFYPDEVDNWLGRNLAKLESDTKISSTDYEAMGLKDPEVKVHVIMEDGAEYTLSFGSSTTLKSTCYFTLNGTDVYTVSRFRKSGFGLKLENFQTTPSTEAE